MKIAVFKHTTWKSWLNSGSSISNMDDFHDFIGMELELISGYGLNGTYTQVCEIVDDVMFTYFQLKHSDLIAFYSDDAVLVRFEIKNKASFRRCNKKLEEFNCYFVESNYDYILVVLHSNDFEEIKHKSIRMCKNCTVQK
jgi:hypothetical protein